MTVTIGDLLAGGAATFAGAGIPEPRREALHLWVALGGSAGDVYVARERTVPAEAAERFERAVARRAAGEPLAYVAGSIGFRTLTLRIDRRALIPRPETEGLVELVLARVPVGRVVDVGTGSGCIALSLAAEGSYRSVIGIDRSAGALALARENAADLGLPVRFLDGDLTTALAPASTDALVSNPPYLTDAEYAELDPAVRDWEPALALPSGADGLDATSRLLTDGRRVVTPGGWIALEVDCTRAAAAADRARALGWADVAIHADLFGRERFLLARRSETP